MLVQHQPHLSLLEGLAMQFFTLLAALWGKKGREQMSTSSQIHLLSHPDLPVTHRLIFPLYRILHTTRMFHCFQAVSLTFDRVDHLESGLHLLPGCAVMLPVTALSTAAYRALGPSRVP